MKILILSWILRKHSTRQHLGTLDRLKEHCECHIYGRDDLEPYKEKLQDKFMELFNVHRPDVVIGYAGMYLMDQGNLFRDMKNCLKLFIEVDYHDQMGKEQWYTDNKFDHMFYRNANDTSAVKIPGCWWPWSAYEDEFYDVPFVPRQNIIGFAGSSVHRIYTVRRKARDILLAHGLLDDRKKTILQTEYDENGKWTGQNGKYQEYLRSIEGLLTSTENRGPFAKTFEAMSSRTVVLSSPIINKELLFGKKQCYVEYKYDCSDIVEKAKFILENDMKQIKENAYIAFIGNHTTDLRAKELYNNIVRLIEGKEVIRKWGL